MYVIDSMRSRGFVCSKFGECHFVTWETSHIQAWMDGYHPVFSKSLGNISMNMEVEVCL